VIHTTSSAAERGLVTSIPAVAKNRKSFCGSAIILDLSLLFNPVSCPRRSWLSYFARLYWPFWMLGYHLFLKPDLINRPLISYDTQRHSCVNRNSKWNTLSPIVYVSMHKTNKLYLNSSESRYSDKTIKPSPILERTGDLTMRPDRLWGQNNLFIYEQ